MRATYVALDGARFEAETPEGLVRKLREASRSATRDDAAFMREAAYRAELQIGRPVRSSAAAAFVEDLIAVGLLAVES